VCCSVHVQNLQGFRRTFLITEELEPFFCLSPPVLLLRYGRISYYFSGPTTRKALSPFPNASCFFYGLVPLSHLEFGFFKSPRSGLSSRRFRAFPNPEPHSFELVRVLLASSHRSLPWIGFRLPHRFGGSLALWILELRIPLLHRRVTADPFFSA